MTSGSATIQFRCHEDEQLWDTPFVDISLPSLTSTDIPQINLEIPARRRIHLKLEEGDAFTYDNLLLAIRDSFSEISRLFRPLAHEILGSAQVLDQSLVTIFSNRLTFTSPEAFKVGYYPEAMIHRDCVGGVIHVTPSALHFQELGTFIPLYPRAMVLKYGVFAALIHEIGGHEMDQLLFPDQYAARDPVAKEILPELVEFELNLAGTYLSYPHKNAQAILGALRQLEPFNKLSFADKFRMLAQFTSESQLLELVRNLEDQSQTLELR